MDEATEPRRERIAEQPGLPQAAPRDLPQFRWEAASLSDVGSVRSENQDACGEARDAAGNLLLIVADGMGGHAGGSTASRLCIETVCREFREAESPLDARLRAAIQQANREVHEAAGRDASLEGMGTTAVALATAPDGATFVAWVGDSRGFRLREARLERITEDHSWVAEAVRSGVLSEEEAEVHPRKNQLTRCIGADPEVEVDVRAVDLRADDRFLLCSDGLWGEVPEPDIAAILGYEPPGSAMRTLVDRANAHGGPDNITVQILAVHGPDEGAPAPFDAADDADEPVRLPLRLVAGVAVVAAALLMLGAYAVLYGGGGFGGAPAPAELAAPVAPPGLEDGGLEDGLLPEPAVAEAPAGPPAAEPLAAPPEAEPVVAPPTPEPLAAPPTPGPPAGAPALAPRIESFLDAWGQAVTTADYALYSGIGLPGTREQFERRYGDRRGALMKLTLLGHGIDPDGLVRARVHMSYGYDGIGGRRQLDSEYKVLLRETGGRLQYAGGWD